MRIDSIRVNHAALVLAHTWKTIRRKSLTTYSVLLKMGIDYDAGCGTSTLLRALTYFPKTAASAYHAITKFLAPLFVSGTLTLPIICCIPDSQTDSEKYTSEIHLELQRIYA